MESRQNKNVSKPQLINLLIKSNLGDHIYSNQNIRTSVTKMIEFLKKKGINSTINYSKNELLNLV